MYYGKGSNYKDNLDRLKFLKKNIVVWIPTRFKEYNIIQNNI